MNRPIAKAYNLKLAALNDAEDGKFEKLDKLRVDNVLNMMEIEHYLPNYKDYLNWAQIKYQDLMGNPDTWEWRNSHTKLQEKI